jgi:hypothetical protein
MVIFNRKSKPVDQPPRQNIFQRVVAVKRRKTFEVPEGDKIPNQPDGRKVNAEELRDLRELIRCRYALAVEIWEMRDALPEDRMIV